MISKLWFTIQYNTQTKISNNEHIGQRAVSHWRSIILCWLVSKWMLLIFEVALIRLFLLYRILKLVLEASAFFGDQDPSEDLPFTRIKHFEIIVNCQLLDTILQLMGPDFETIGEIGNNSASVTKEWVQVQQVMFP